MPNIPTRLNNPGDLRPTNPTQPKQETASGSFRQFDNPGKGFEALLNDLQAKISGKSSTGLGPKSTLADFSSAYAPESDDNSPGQYTVNLANQLKVRPDTTLGELQPRIGEFAQAIANNEGYEWSDQPAASEQDKIGLGQQILEAGPATAKWMLEHVVPLETLAAGGVGGIAALAGGGVAAPAVAGAAAAPSLLSKAVKFGAGLLGIKGAEDVATAAYNAVKGSPEQPQAQTPQQPDVLSQIQNQMQPQIKASTANFEALNSALNTYQAGRVFLSDDANKDALTNMSMSGRSPDVSEGTMDFTQASKELEKEQATTHKMGGAVVGEGEMKTSEAVKNAEKYIQKNLTPNEREAVIKYIKSEAGSYGKSISLVGAHEARVQQWASSRFDTLRKPSAQVLAHKALASGFKESVLNHTQNKDAYKKLLKHEQDLAREKKIHKLLHGKKPPAANSFTKGLHKFGTRLFATYVGDKIGGVLGAVLGNVILDIGQKSAEKIYGKNIFDSPEVKAGLKVLREELPSQYAMFKKEMESKGIKFPKEGTEEGLIKGMKEGGVNKAEKVLTHALNESKKTLRKEQAKESIIKKYNPGAYAKSRAISNKKSKKRLSYHDRTMVV